MKNFLRALTALLPIIVVMGCGASGKDGSTTQLDPAANAAGTPGAMGTGGGPASGGGLSLGVSGSQTAPTSSGGAGAINPGMACATGTASANLSDVRMLVMFDRSSSMNDEAIEATAETRWDLASAALSGFFAEPSAAGLQVALRFFPHDEPAPGCNDDDCSVQACTEPIVALGTLSEEAAPADPHEAALIAATVAAVPQQQGGGQQGASGGTPISAALGGALAWAAAQRSAAPDETAVVVLVTDGQPRGCDVDVTNIAALAADALTDSGTLTYAIGLTGSREADMDAIAAAGGTTEGIFITDGATAQQELLDALSAIRGSVLDCDFPLPEAGPGMTIDPAQINVNYTPSGGMTTTLGRVPDAASCGTGPGWYYDNPQTPTAILLCPGSCGAASLDFNATLEVLLGCVTQERDPA